MMNKYLTIRVVCPDHVHPGDEKELYRNTILVDDSLDIPFKVLIQALRLLYQQAGAKVVFGYEF